SKSMILPPVLRTIVQGLPQFPTARAIAPAPATGAATAAVEVTATANKHITSERNLMMHLQWCIRTKRFYMLGLVRRADLIKTASNATATFAESRFQRAKSTLLAWLNPHRILATRTRRTCCNGKHQISILRRKQRKSGLSLDRIMFHSGHDTIEFDPML